MSRRPGVATTLKAALLATLATALLNGCIFSPEKKVIDTPPEAPIEIIDEESLIQALAASYRNRNISEFTALLANDPDNNAEYLFITDPAAGQDQWGYQEEVRIHQRMFEPENTPPGQSPVPTEFWLTSITITLTRSTEFTERTDLYESASNPTGLPKDKWRVTDAIYATDVLFDTQGELDFQVTARANFVVIEDLEKTNDDDGKWLILQWNDLPAKPSPPSGLPS